MNIDIKNRVHELYWGSDTNCARTTLICLSELFDTKIETQTYQSAVGLHGAGKFRAQCGLVEGVLMFIGLYFSEKGMPEDKIIALCYRYAELFTNKFGSLTCYDLRPNGFNADDPPHLCEGLTVNAIEFAYEYINNSQIKASS